MNLSFVIPVALFYALVMSNVGTIFRDKAQILPILFVHVSNGALVLRARRAKTAFAAVQRPCIPVRPLHPRREETP